MHAFMFILFFYLGTVDTEVVDRVEARVGKEDGAGEGTTAGSNTGITGSETGTRAIEVAISQALQTPIRDTTLILRDRIMTATDLLNLSRVFSI